MQIIETLRRKASAVRRTVRGLLAEPDRPPDILPDVISKLENIERRMTQLELELRKSPPLAQDFSGAGIELVRQNILSLNQGWPRLSTAFSQRVTLNSQAPIPPLSSRARIQGAKCINNTPADGHFLTSGFNDLRAVFNIAGVFGVELDQNLSV